jgi:hypothetical protein
MAAVTAGSGGLLSLVQPGDEILPLGVEFRGDLGGRLVAVARGSVEIGAAGQEALGGPALAAVAGLPEGLGDVVW